MDAARWERVQDIFHRVADLPESERDALLDLACCDDPSLRIEIQNLLREDARGGSVLDRDVAELARTVFGSDPEKPLPQNRFGPYRITRVLAG